MKRRVLVTCRQMQRELPVYAAELAERGIEVVAPDVVQQLTEDELIAHLDDVDGVIAGDDPFTERVLASAPRLRVVSKWGIGTDAIDKAAAARLGVPVTNTPGVFADEVADVAMGYVLMLARGLHLIDRAVRQGGWLKIEGETVRGRTLGIVGLGSIGRAVAARAGAFGFSLVGFDPVPEAAEAARGAGIDPLPVDGVFARSDYLVLCCPLTPDNRHLVNRRRLASMPPGARLINVARGPLVDEAALVDALREGRLAGAALDVFESEPLPADSPLRDFDCVIFGSHNGSNTRQGVERTSRLALENLLAHLDRDTS